MTCFITDARARSRAEPRIAAFLVSPMRKPLNKWEEGDPYYESVKRTIPETF